MPKVTIVKPVKVPMGQCLREFTVGDVVECVTAPRQCQEQVGNVYVVGEEGNAACLTCPGGWAYRGCVDEFRYKRLDVDEIKLILK